MSHKHSVYDNDGYFVLDPKTKSFRNESEKDSIIQHDHNSEEIRFKFPKIIEGHDMSKVDLIQVHFDNTSVGTSASLRTTNAAPVNITSTLETCEDDSEYMRCSWLVGEESTQLAGSLKFKLKFVCYGDDDTTAYKMNTLYYDKYQVLESSDSSEGFIDIYQDILSDIEKRLTEAENKTISQEQISEAVRGYFEDNPIDLDNYVPTSRAIAGVDLADDITAEELQDGLSVYPIVEFSRSPKIDTEELELVGKVGQLGMYKSYNTVDFYRCLSVTPHPQYANTFIYEWEFIGSNSNCEYIPYSLGEDLNYSGGAPLRGNMVYSDSSSGKALYIRVVENSPLIRIPIATAITTTVDENSTDEQIPSAKAVYNLFSTYDTSILEILGGDANVE